MKRIEIDHYFTVPEAAAKAKIHPQTVYKAIWNGLLPVLQVAGNYLIHRNDLRTWRAGVEQRKND